VELLLDEELLDDVEELELLDEDELVVVELELLDDDELVELVELEELLDDEELLELDDPGDNEQSAAAALPLTSRESIFARPSLPVACNRMVCIPAPRLTLVETVAQVVQAPVELKASEDTAAAPSISTLAGRFETPAKRHVRV
jgi:hypothetical protein